MGIADLPDINEDDWNAYTANQFRAATDPILDSLRFQHDTATGFDPIFSQVMAQQQADDERRRQEEELARQQQMQMRAQQQARMAQMQQASAPYDDLRAMMSAPDGVAPTAGGLPPIQGPPGPNEVLPGVPKGGGDQPGFWSGTNPGAPNVFSYIGQEAQRGADELRRSGATQVPVIGGLMGGTAQGVANFANTLGGAAEGLRGGDPFAAVGGPLQATIGETGPLEGMWRSVAEEYQTPEQVLPFIDPDTPVIGGLNNPREWGGIAGNVVMPETAAEQAFGKGLSAVGKPVLRAAGQAAQPLVEAVGRAADQFGMPGMPQAEQGITRGLGEYAGAVGPPGRILTREGAARIGEESAQERFMRQIPLNEPLTEPEPFSVFFSRLGESINALPQERMTVGQAKSALSKMGVKPDEMRWTGIEDALSGAPNTPITKSELQNLFAQGNVQVREIVNAEPKGTPEWEAANQRYLELEQEHRQLYEDYVQSFHGVGASSPQTEEMGRRLVELNNQKVAAANALTSLPMPEQAPGAQGPRYEQYLQNAMPGQGQHGRPGAREVLLTINTPGRQMASGYTSGHWDPENIVVHARLTDRTLPDGRKALHVEEVQSDWHQAGRERGYQPSPDEVQALIPEARGHAKALLMMEEELRAYKAKHYAEQRAIRDWMNSTTNLAAHPDTTARAERLREIVIGERELRNMVQEAKSQAISFREQGDIQNSAWDVAEIEAREASLDRIQQQADRTDFDDPMHKFWDDEYRAEQIEHSMARNRMQGMGVSLGMLPPRAPFEKTPAWTALAMKRLLRMASDEGYDVLSWTPAEVQGARYGNAFHDVVNRIEYDPSAGILYTRRPGGQVEYHEVREDILPQWIGADRAQRLFESEPRPSQLEYEVWGQSGIRESEPAPVHVLDEAAINVQSPPSEGMRLQYDKVMPQVMADIGKPWGARSGMGEIELWPGGDRSQAHMVEITPEMRQSVSSQGLPLFLEPPESGQQGGPVTPNGQWPSQWGPQPKPQIRLPNIHPAWQNYQRHALMRRARSQMIGGAAVGGVTGAAAGGAGAYAATDENDNPALRALAVGSGAISGGVAGLALGAIGSPVALGAINRGLIDLIDKRVLEGKIPVTYLQTHPPNANRIRAMMRVMAQDAQPGEVVRVPELVGALDKVSNLGLPDEVRPLVAGNLTKEEVLSLLGPGDPTAESKDLKSMVIDFIRALPMGTERAEEHAADIFAAQGRMGQDVDRARMRAATQWGGGGVTPEGNQVGNIATQIAEHLGLDTSGPNRLFGVQRLGGHVNDNPNIGFQMRTRREAQAGGKPILVWNTAFENLPLTKDEFADVMAHEFYHFLEEVKRNDRGLWSMLTDQAGQTPVGRFAGVAGESGGELADDLKPDEDVLPPPESASDYLSRVVNELTPAGRAAAQRYGEEVAHRAPWAGNVIEQTERLPEGNRWEQVLRVAQPEGAADDSAAIGDAMDAANAANPLPYTPPVKRPAGPRDDRNLGGANVLANQPEGMQEMAAQGIADLQQELRASHGFRTEKESREAAERVMEFILPFAREAQPNEPVNEALLRAGREAWAQSHWPSYYAMIDHAKMAADPDADPDLLAAAKQAMDYWQGIRQVLGRYAGEIAPSESGRTFRSMRDVPGPVVPGIAGGSGEAAAAVNRAAKTPREKAYEDILVKMRQARRGEQAGQDVSTTATQRTVQRVGGKRPNGPLAAMGLDWEDILRRSGNDDVDRANLLAGLEELGGYRFRRDRTKAAMNLDLNDGAAVGKFWDEARTAAGVDKEMRPFVKFDPNVSGQSYLGGADTITKQQALQMVSKELIKDADEATAALRAARNQGKSPTVLRDLEATAKRAYERMGLRIESWPPDSFPVLRRAAESVRNRIEREWPADRKAGSGAEEAVEKKRQLLGIFDQELKKEQKLAGVPVTGLQDLMSFGTSNVLATPRFVQASVLESALSSINEPFQSFLRGDYAGAGRQLQGLGRAFGLITSGDIAALGEGIKAPAIVNALRGIKDIGPMQAAGEMRDVAERGAGHIRSDSASRLAELMSPMQKVSRGISEAFQTGNYFGEVNRLVHTAAESGVLPGGRRIEQIVDETGVKRNPNVREMLGNLPQEIVDAALKQSRFVNEGGHAGWLERQLGDAKGLLNKPGASGGERATGLFANLMFPFVYGLRPMIKSGTRTLFSAPIHGAEFAKAIRAGDGEGAKYAAKKFALANSFNGFIAYHVISGNITGHGPQDPGTRQALMEATDEHGDPIWRPDSIRIPNPGGDGHTWVKYTSMPGPVSIVATVMGNMYEAYAFDGKDMESTAETLSRVMPEIAKGVMDNTYFRDMINLVEALNATGGAPGISRVAGQVAGRFVPGAGALRTAATLMDPQQRLATNPVEDIQSGIPGLRERLPAQVSPYSGRPSEQPLSPVTALGGISGNVYASPSERNPIARETVAASRRSLPWEGGVRPSEGLESDVFPRTFTRGEQSRGLDFAGARQTGEGIRGAQAAFGRESGEEMLRLIESPQYQAADPRLKAQMLTQAANRSGQRGEYAAIGAPGVVPSPEKQLERAKLQTARFRGVRGAPDEIAEQNQKIAQARETLSELSARIGRSRAINLMRKTDPEAYRLATRYRPMSQDRLWMQEQANKASLGIPDDDGQFLIPDFGTGGNMLDLTGLPNMQNRRPSQRR